MTQLAVYRGQVVSPTPTGQEKVVLIEEERSRTAGIRSMLS